MGATPLFFVDKPASPSSTQNYNFDNSEGNVDKTEDIGPYYAFIFRAIADK